MDNLGDIDDIIQQNLHEIPELDPKIISEI